MTKKILILSLSYYPKHIGGAEIAVKEITDRIASDKIEFHMITNRYDSSLPKVERIGNVLVHRIGIAMKNPATADMKRFPLRINKFLFQFFAFFKACHLHNLHKYDGIWAIMAHATGVPAGMFKRAFPSVTYILTLQEGDPPAYIERKMSIFGPLFKYAFTRADILQSISIFLEQWGVQMGFRGKSVVIPNAVNTALFAREMGEDEISSIQIELGKREGDIFLVTTSRLVSKNALDDVLRAMMHMSARVHFLIYGDGPDKQSLLELAHALGVENRVRFMGYIDHAHMPKYLKACDIFIRPSRSEGMGNSFIEAMAIGIPVVATQQGGIADFLFDSKRNQDKTTTGWAVDVNSPEQIVEVVNEIVASPQKRLEVINNAKAMVLAKYDWNLVAKDMQEKVFRFI